MVHVTACQLCPFAGYFQQALKGHFQARRSNRRYPKTVLESSTWKKPEAMATHGGTRMGKTNIPG